MKDHVWGSRADEMREFLFGSPDAAVPAQPSWEQVQKAIFMYVRFVEMQACPTRTSLRRSRSWRNRSHRSPHGG